MIQTFNNFLLCEAQAAEMHLFKNNRKCKFLPEKSLISSLLSIWTLTWNQQAQEDELLKRKAASLSGFSSVL